MESLKLWLPLLVLLGFVCTGNGDTFPGLFSKRNDDAETNDKVSAATVASAGKSAGEPTATATTTSEPGTSCGGLKGFLHICDKNEPADPSKNVKRSVSDDDSDEDSDSSESDDSDDSEERPGGKSSATTEKAIAKRQAEDPEAPDAPEEPPMVDSALPETKDTPEEEAAATKKRQADDDSSSSEETDDDRRRRRSIRRKRGY